MYVHVVVGTDGSETARLAVEHAAHLARASQATVHLVHAGDGRAVLDEAAAALEADGLVVRTHLSAAAPANALCDVAEDVMADVIVVGSKGMRGARRILGSVPNDVAHRVGCAVLIVPTC